MFSITTADQWLPALAAFPSLLKIFLLLLIWLIVWLPWGIIVAIICQWRWQKNITGTQKLALVGTLYLVFFGVFWGVTQVEQTSLRDYGWVWGISFWMQISLGLLIGTIGVGVLVGLELVWGWVLWRGLPRDDPGNHGENQEKVIKKAPENKLNLLLFSVILPIVLPTLAIALLISGVEELIFRGVFLNILQQDYSLWVAAMISSAIFAVLHLLWEQQETLPQIPGLWLMGMVLVVARLAAGGSLGLAIGLHAGWIVAIATIDTAQLLQYPNPVNSSKPWLIGYYHKPLAGIMGISLLFGTGLILQIFKAVI
ncbi:MAG: CPBP family intramembrane metalloprotease [Coleofasciculaceae cyanobacterium SM2_1_6]|nr:CPBP family intramembrane metalloprotease [Coleofasciculaceae cyanobacterium SM2_1_6]